MDPGVLASFLPVLYPAIFLAVAVDAFIPPLPAEVLTITSGAMSAHGDANFGLGWLAAFLGCWAGDLAVYILFRRRLTGLLVRWRWGRAVQRQLDAAIARAGRSATDAALIAARFLPGGRTASMAAAGISGVATRRVILLDAVGAALWAVWTVGLGFVTGSTADLPTWAGALLGSVIGLSSGALIAAVLAWRTRRARPVTSHDGDRAGVRSGGASPVPSGQHDAARDTGRHDTDRHDTARDDTAQP
ncbi:DedA family protein [Tersicoccus sp. MR15.9]|uniref:DedA family protein n=1 Tax=Tersicoccus mangrovi TaxID=3121635 RepID=UPI002FE5AC45